MRLVAAPDKFKGSASAADIAAAIAFGAREAGWEATERPLADGGEGTLEAFGGPNRWTTVANPLGVPVEAGWRLDDERAVIEMARASGLDLVGGAEGNDPIAASTRGTGELIAAAMGEGARSVLVGAGGSATTDGGWGAVEALDGRPFPDSGVEVVVACDVTTTFEGTAPIFSWQKGADEEAVAELGRRLTRLADHYREHYNVDVRVPCAGAAGGLAGGLLALGARLESGFDLIADELDFDASLRGMDLVVTGEGRLDHTSFRGKVVGGVSDRASRVGLPILAVTGEVVHGDEVDRIPSIALVERFGLARSRRDPLGCVREVVREHLLSG